MAEIYHWNTSADQNNNQPPDGAPENMPPSTVNNVIREVFAVIARGWNATNASITSSSTISNANTTKNQYNITSGQAGTDLVAGQRYTFVANATSITGSSMLQVDSRANKDLRGRRSSGLIQGEVAAGRAYEVVYTGTDYLITNSTYDTGGPELCVVSGTNNAIALTPIVAAQIYDIGVQFRFYAATTSTGAVTVNVSALGAKDLFVGGSNVGAGDITAGSPYTIEYDGTQFRVVAGPLGELAFSNDVAELTGKADIDLSNVDSDLTDTERSTLLGKISAVYGGDDVTDVVSLTQTAYDALTPDATTLYLITG